MRSEQRDPLPRQSKPRLADSSILHRCDPDGDGEMCFCMYDAECTGRLGRRMVRLPVWLDVMLRPRYAWRVLDARRRLANR